MPRPQRRQHNGGYKRLFAHRRVVADLLRGYVDADGLAGLDLSTLRRENGSYVADDLRERESDVVWRLRSRTGWVYVYVLIEFQSTIDRYMAVRMLAYVALLWQDLIRSKRLVRGGLLPPVVPIVLYNGGRRWRAPTELGPLIAPPPEHLACYQPAMKYLLFDEVRTATQEGLRTRNVSAAIFALEQQGEDGHRTVVQALCGWLAGQPNLLRALGAWYVKAVAPARLPGLPEGRSISLTEVRDMMATNLIRDRKRRLARARSRGEARGEARGVARGALSTICELVRSGLLAPSAARTQIGKLRASGTVPAHLAALAVARLPPEP